MSKVKVTRSKCCCPSRLACRLITSQKPVRLATSYRSTRFPSLSFTLLLLLLIPNIFQFFPCRYMRFVSSQLLPSSFLWHLNPLLLSFRLAISSDLFVFTYSLTGHLTGRNVHRGCSYYYYYYSLLRQRQHITDMKSNTIRSTSWIWKRLVKFQCSFNVISQQYLCNATDMI